MLRFIKGSSFHRSENGSVQLTYDGTIDLRAGWVPDAINILISAKIKSLKNANRFIISSTWIHAFLVDEDCLLRSCSTGTFAFLFHFEIIWVPFFFVSI